MTPAAWPELGLEPDPIIFGSANFEALCTAQLERQGETKQYALVCEKNGLKFAVNLSGILSKQQDGYDPYRPNKTLTELRQTLNDAYRSSSGRSPDRAISSAVGDRPEPGQSELGAVGDRPEPPKPELPPGPALEEFLRYSPWLIPTLTVKGGGLSPVQQGAMLARLLDLIIRLMETENLVNGQWRNVYHLLLRSQFLLLARLSQSEQYEEASKYLRDLDFHTRGAWQSWGQAILQAPREMSLQLARYGRGMEAEGSLLLFTPQGGQLWDFVQHQEAQPFVEQLLTGWFLPRYDLDRVTMALSQTHPPNKLGLLSRLAAKIYQVPLWGRIAFYGVTLIALTIPLLPISLKGWPSFFQTWGLAVGYRWWWGAVVLTLLTVGWYLMGGVQTLRYTIPRLTLAIIIGLLALVSSGELLTFAIRAYDHHWPVAWVTVLGSSLLAFGAIYLGVRRHVVEGWVAVKRAGVVWLIAATRSLVLGWLILAPAGSLLLAGSDLETIRYQWAGPLGLPIYPQLILVLAPLALFIGIFVQTIWEESALTHPI